MSNLSNFSNQYRFTLERGSKKHRCPSCGKTSFVRYIDKEKGNYLPMEYGRCDRESKCNYHLNPYKDDYAKQAYENEGIVTKVTKVTQLKHYCFDDNYGVPSPSKPVFFNYDTFQPTLAPDRHTNNTFIQCLLYKEKFPFESNDVKKIVELYQLGTVTKGYRAGACTFPFIDVNGNVRAIQVKQFDEANHTISTDFLHSIIEKHYTSTNKPLPEWLTRYKNQEKIISCFFGEHLLKKYPNNPVALVEAPKTCIYATLYFGFPVEKKQNFLWLGVYNLSSLTFDKIKVLDGKQVVLFPDLSKDGIAYRLWKEKSEEYQRKIPGAKFIVSDLLELHANTKERGEGLDLADYLTNLNWRLFRGSKDGSKTENPIKVGTTKTAEKSQQSFTIPIQQKEKRQANENKQWDIQSIEDFFKKINLPKDSITLKDGSTIHDPERFVNSHLATVKANNGVFTFEPYLLRLITLKNNIENGTTKIHG